MKWSDFFTSSVGKKFIMALTGISLILFLVVHVGLNACIWANDGGEMFNKAAHFMGATVVVRILEIGLFAGIFLHIIQGYVLTLHNNSRRTVKYAVNYGQGSKWYSRSMGLLGTLILLFLIMHIYHFWTPSRLGGIASIHSLEPVTYMDGREIHNLYGEMLKVFQNNLVIVVLYVLGCISLAYHLLHGFQSSLRTMGVHNKRYIALIKATGTAFSIIVPLAFAMMPISMYLGWVV
ncbi:MAG TPA: succinate dehydrogenase cytochrome b subunit [Chitinophagaceae bacterium]|nr:succinate dehydrogenase cytochrome b subunit [Chitinophagaceae bacterium]